MKIEPIFRNYELLVDKAESAYKGVIEEHGSCVKCEIHCSDCCHAVFGLFLIEAAYIREHFEEIDEKQKEAALERGNQADIALEKLQEKLNTFKDDPHMQIYTLARERIRCPLLDDRNECILYHRRPITCRAYGIPTKIQGKVHACGKAQFKDGEKYPIFDLDGVYGDLFVLSKELIDEAEIDNDDKASLLISISKIIKTPLNELLRDDFREIETKNEQ